MDLASHDDATLINMLNEIQQILKSRFGEHTCEDPETCYACLKWKRAELEVKHWCPKPQCCDFCKKIYNIYVSTDGKLHKGYYDDYDCDDYVEAACYACTGPLTDKDKAYCSKSDWKLIQCQCSEHNYWVLCNGCVWRDDLNYSEESILSFSRNDVPILYVYGNCEATIDDTNHPYNQFKGVDRYYRQPKMANPDFIPYTALCNMCGPKYADAVRYYNEATNTVLETDNPFKK
jgi:hypothetical protein